VSEMVYNNQEVVKMTYFRHISVIYLNALERSQPGVSNPSWSLSQSLPVNLQQVRHPPDTCLASV
jgi:hypothetical protein